MRTNKERPTCDKVDCAGCQEGRCISLTDNKFKNKECPFYKTKEQAEEDNAKRLERLVNIGREVNYYG